MIRFSQEVGARLRAVRRTRGMTLAELAEAVHRTPSALSKYESGAIRMDLDVLAALAGALGVRLEQIVYTSSDPASDGQRSEVPEFFRGLSELFGYIYDGRSGRLLRCFFEICAAGTDGIQPVTMYMNFDSYENYRFCENTYAGQIEHFDALTHIQMVNQDTAMEKASLQILATYLASDTKWGLFNGFSSRPMMPIAAKMLLSRTRLAEDKSLLAQLRISREDVRMLRLYNMFPVVY